MDVFFYGCLGIWGGKGQGKTFQTELIFKTMGVEPVIMSAGELESDRAGDFFQLCLLPYRRDYVVNHFLGTGWFH
jgi:hypothetical protein